MDTRVTEIADGIHQLTTYVAEMDWTTTSRREPSRTRTRPGCPSPPAAATSCAGWRTWRWARWHTAWSRLHR